MLAAVAAAAVPVALVATGTVDRASPDARGAANRSSGRSGGGISSAPGSGSSAESPSAVSPSAVAPLTGLPFSDPSQADRPALTVDVVPDATEGPGAGSGPVAALEAADVVYEEVTASGGIEDLAVYQSRGVDAVGPLGPAQPSDASLLAPLHPLYAYGGGPPEAVAAAVRAGARDEGSQRDPSAFVTEGLSPSLSADPSGPSTGGVVDVRPDVLWSLAEGSGLAGNGLAGSGAGTARGVPGAGGAAPAPLWDYTTLGVPFEAAGMSTVGSVSIGLSPESSLTWTWDPSANRWSRSPFVTATGGAGGGETGGQPGDRSAPSRGPAADNVVVEYVPYVDTTWTDATGQPVPYTSVLGSGRGLVLSGGTIARVTWRRSSVAKPVALSDAVGRPVALAPGTTWVELVPAGRPAPTCSGGSGLASAVCGGIGAALSSARVPGAAGADANRR